MIAGTPRLATLLDTFHNCSVLIVGDVMLDQFLTGRVQRISPEAPVPVVEYERDEYRPGGAANVAQNVVALGGRVMLVGLIGPDEAAERLVAELRAIGVPVDGLVTDATRCTTRKLRIVTTRNQQVARIDYESEAEPAAPIDAAVQSHLREAATGADVIVVSDYLKGGVTRSVMSAALEAGRRADVPVLVDPKIPHIHYYAGATLITPNHHEAEVATHLRIRTAEEARSAARAFQKRAVCDSVLITRGEHGMWLLEGSQLEGGRSPIVLKEAALPATAREVADVTGAGDTVLATLALGIAAGGQLIDAAEIANHAAGVAVGKFGPAAVSPAELRDVMASRPDTAGTPDRSIRL
jgi:rfaE bifunctional protein kinase chain/domain